MIKAQITYHDNYAYLKVSGHANYAEYGQDIVCSGVTTAVFTSLGLLQKILLENEYQYSEHDGQITFETTNCNEMVSLIFQNLADVLANIERQYPNNLKLEIAKK